MLRLTKSVALVLAAVTFTGRFAWAAPPVEPSASAAPSASTAPSASAAPAPAPGPRAAAGATPSELDDRRWPETVPAFRWWEYVATPLLMGGSLALRFTVDVSGEPTWKSGFLHDEATMDLLFVDSPKTFKIWRTVGDIGYFASFAWTGVDPLLAGLVYDWDTAAQMALMNFEAFAVYSMILSVSQIVVRRERPSTRVCGDPLARELGISCTQNGTNENVNRSFIGGHTGTVATAATLTCIHHAKLGLWGSPQADALPCVTWTAMTALVFASRTRTGQHYFTDNLLGVTVGGLSALVPYGLHYALAEDAALPRSSLITPTMLAVAPAPQNDGLTLQVGGLLH